LSTLLFSRSIGISTKTTTFKFYKVA